MKPCTFGGTNESCRYCFGSGYVTDRTPVPRPPTPRQPIPISLVDREPSPPVFAKRSIHWKEIIGGVLALLFPFIIVFFLRFLRWLLN